MRLDHLIAADALGTPLGEPQRARVAAVLQAFGFARTADGWALDDTFPWVRIVDSDGQLHVTVTTPLPAHVASAAIAALEGLVTEAGLARIDPFTRGEIDPADWSRRVAGVAPPGRGLR